MRCAISDRDGESRISDTDDVLGNRLVEAGGTVVPAKTIESLCRSLGIEEVDFLKMNIEGAEREAVRGFGAIPVKHLVISCHDFLGGPHFPTFAEVRAALIEQGYSVRSRPDHPLAYTRFNIYAAKP